jgi:hypothetical protein
VVLVVLVEFSQGLLFRAETPVAVVAAVVDGMLVV